TVLGDAASRSCAASDAGDGGELDRPGAFEGSSDADGPAAGGVGGSRGFFARAWHGGAERAVDIARATGRGSGRGRSRISEGAGADYRAGGARSRRRRNDDGRR